jgi:hypothetical protein
MGFANFTIIEIPEPPSIGCRSGYYTSDQVYTLKAKITPDETGLKSAVYSLNGADPVAMTTVEGQDYTHTATLTLQETHNTVVITATDNEDEARSKTISIYRIPCTRYKQQVIPKL